MARTTFGETLQHLFREHELGNLSSAEFETRKHLLLKQSKCRLPAFVPEWRRDLALAAAGAAGAVAAMLVFLR